VLSVDTDYILSLCSQRIILMKRLCHQGLALTYLLIVSQAIIVSRIMYAILAYGCFLSTGLNGMEDLMLFSSVVTATDLHLKFNKLIVCLITFVGIYLAKYAD